MVEVTDAEIADYYSIARRFAARYYHGFDPAISRDDIAQEAVLKALGAHERFVQRDGGVRRMFVSQRVQGAVIDFIRDKTRASQRTYGVPRQHRQFVSDDELENVADERTPHSDFHKHKLAEDARYLLFACCNARERVVLLRWLSGETATAIAADYGVTQSRMSQVVNSLLDRIREFARMCELNVYIEG